MSLTEDQVRTMFAGLASGESEKFFEHVDENVHWRLIRRSCKK
jgi:ketosteroid isomerase-like protein